MRRLLIVDDHPLYREGVVAALAQPPLCAVVHGAASRQEALQLLCTQPGIDLALVDFKLAGESGIDALAAIGAAHPAVVRVLLSGEASDVLSATAARIGAQGFIPKSHSVDQLVHALQTLLDGGVYWPATGGADALRTGCAGARDAHALTLRQLEVLQLLAQGKSNLEIGASLGVTERTVKAHLQSVFEHLQVHSRVQALIRARELGLLALDPAR